MFRHKWWLWRAVASGAFIVALVAFPYGPLFPWSPVHPGYERKQFARADVLYPSGSSLAAYDKVDLYVAEAEKFHQLPVKSRLTVVACRNWTDVVRFVPMPNARMLAGATLPTGTVIYITPKVAEKGLDTGEFLRHEISHATLNQNQSFFSAWRMKRHEWFAEGLAVSFGNQKAFVTPEEFVTFARERDLAPIIDPEQRMGSVNMRVAYQAWRYFLEYLDETGGRETFHRYMVTYMSRPSGYREEFVRHYGDTLPNTIQRFQGDVKAGRWSVNPQFAATREQ